MLSYYFEWGKKAINRQKQKDIKTQELITAKAFKQKKHEYKIKLLQDIIDSHPKSEKIDLFEYTPEIFKSLNLDISIIKEKQLSPKQQINLTANEYIKNITPIIQLKNKLREKAITLINYIITDNEKWPTLEDKLTAIEECLATETEYFLKEALEYNESENLSTIIASEELANKKDEKQTSTNISQELPKIETPKIEEEKEKPEFRMPQHKPTLQISQLSSSVNDPFKQPQKYVKKTKKAQQPTGWIPYIWQGITNTINTVYYFFSWAIREVKDILGINND